MKTKAAIQIKAIKAKSMNFGRVLAALHMARAAADDVCGVSADTLSRADHKALRDIYRQLDRLTQDAWVQYEAFRKENV